MISGISFIRNGIKLGYPFIPSIQSLLPLVDELVVVAGDSDDGTTESLLALSISEPKLKIVHSVWDTSPRNGLVLSEQTNLAIQHCQAKATSDWIVLLQSDEVFHDEDYPHIRAALHSLPETCQGIAFRYRHFYGGVNVLQHTCTSYRHEVRAIRPGAVSVGDGQTFRRADGSKVTAQLIDAYVYHYGWARPQDVMIAKTQTMDSLYQPNTGSAESAKYKNLLGLYPFTGTHPKVMAEFIRTHLKSWEPWKLQKTWGIKDLRKVVVDCIEYWTGIRLGEFKSYEDFRRS